MIDQFSFLTGEEDAFDPLLNFGVLIAFSLYSVVLGFRSSRRLQKGAAKLAAVDAKAGEICAALASQTRGEGANVFRDNEAVKTAPPSLCRDDPLHFGVQVPVSFWKVIAFIHDRTGELSATGYRMNQRHTLPSETEFVFGDFVSSHTNEAAQVTIRSMEDEIGLDFGGLAARDPLAELESLGGSPILPLPRLEAERFF